MNDHVIESLITDIKIKVYELLCRKQYRKPEIVEAIRAIAGSKMPVDDRDRSIWISLANGKVAIGITFGTDGYAERASLWRGEQFITPDLLAESQNG